MALTLIRTGVKEAGVELCPGKIRDDKAVKFWCMNYNVIVHGSILSDLFYYLPRRMN